jgi:hypothetical protein
MCIRAFEMQPSSKQSNCTLNFPNTAPDFELLKNLGSDHSIKKMTFHIRVSVKPIRVSGLTLTFRNGTNITLGKEGEGHSATDLPRKVRSIQMDSATSTQDGTYRNIRFFDDHNDEIDYNGFWNPLFPDQPAIKKEIPNTYELIGVSLAMDAEGFITWVNFLTWPVTVPIL